MYGPTYGFYPGSETNNDTNTAFEAALSEYGQGLYKQAAAKLESLLTVTEAESVKKAGIILLLGICYEKSGNEEKARWHYEALKKMHNDGSIDKIPEITGVDPGSLSGYRAVFEESFFKFKAPIAASEMIKKNVVHAPRKSIEAKEKEKKKKKFPLLIIIGAVVIIGTAAVLLLTQVKKKQKEEPDNPEIVWEKVPADDFLMGDNFNEGDADEIPVHKVYLDEFHISKYEITNAWYNNFCEDTGRTFSPTHGTSYPVNNVTWHDAKAFCNWLSQKTGEKIDLPTEAQWEKAARGKEQRRYPWRYDTPNCAYVVYFGCGNSTDEPANLVPVYQSPGFEGRSFHEAYHMAGNVSEWCRDWYSSSYYHVSPTENPQGPAAGTFRVIRGGNISSRAFDLRAANRDFKNPDYASEEHGFRIVKE
jgi:formylglycine-generating enzyme required for sulfatase activity